MINIGRWTGSYKYDKEINQKILGFDSTNFEIEITNVVNNTFKGVIQDDLSTGGTEGLGEIAGKVFGNKVEFIKQMPISTIIIDNKGTRKTLNKKHPKIYYTGTFSDDRKTISGSWRFKFGFIWFGIIPIPYFPTKGTWKMNLKE